MTTQTAAAPKKMTNAQKKAWVIAKLDASQRNVELAILAIYRRQTAQEQNADCTVEQNGVGFSGTDAEFGSSLAKGIEKYGHLTAKQAVYARKIIGKYWAQLVEVAEAKGTLPTTAPVKTEGISIPTVTTDGLVVPVPTAAAPKMAAPVNTAPTTTPARHGRAQYQLVDGKLVIEQADGSITPVAPVSYAFTCFDEDRHDGEPCTCAPKFKARTDRRGYPYNDTSNNTHSDADEFHAAGTMLSRLGF